MCEGILSSLRIRGLYRTSTAGHTFSACLLRLSSTMALQSSVAKACWRAVACGAISGRLVTVALVTTTELVLRRIFPPTCENSGNGGSFMTIYVLVDQEESFSYNVSGRQTGAESCMSTAGDRQSLQLAHNIRQCHHLTWCLASDENHAAAVWPVDSISGMPIT